MADEKFTVSCKISQPDGLSFLKAYDRMFNKLERKFFVDHFVKEKPLNTLKSSYQIENGIMARQFNSISYCVRGKWGARKVQYIEQLKNIENSIAAVYRGIEKNNREIDKNCIRIDKIKKYQNAIQLWKTAGKGRKPSPPRSLKNAKIITLEKDIAKLKNHSKMKKIKLKRQRRLPWSYQTPYLSS